MRKYLWFFIIAILIVVFIYIFQNTPAPSSDLGTTASQDRFSVTVTNVSEEQTLSPGVFVVHDGQFSLNYDGELAPTEIIPLAEYGEPDSFIEFIKNQTGVIGVYPVNEPLPPGESLTFAIGMPDDAIGDARLSGVEMVVTSNDGIAVLSSVPLFENGTPVDLVVDASNYDTGVEENKPLGSGYGAGQPDPSRGEDNIDNGTATEPQALVRVHPQLTETIMEVQIVPVAP